MSKLIDRIEKLSVEIGMLQDDLETLKSKQARISMKRSRKTYRKKLARDPVFRAIMSMTSQMNRVMFQPSDISMHVPLTRLIP